ncbi:relaxin receptor 1-like isoform X1 [Branchiostoma floridae]|uniref:Relaxin receptor 1-like isoform X1 n=1 Tax=Branchiostoma floridae TaxID=7739 RepID=A0A9J7LFV0_BRAFL|nr:relaxin receptor 1-like isoform X1 [Branchiostoma floridae]XP_035682002.1 relaxin receptor 1-like isoform X1 [Branchiostoma floridae]XP_035682003.1 relaxin receptor 1-like isoform X1 [Branchiostoma floridae]XP_035682004.1 relaxin receptor 1-like isoform X1 [Branchiostoma floridae]
MAQLVRVLLLTTALGIIASGGSAYDPAAVLHCREPSLCPVGEFHCGNMTKCVPQELQCDGHDDCGNNEDEMFCGDNTIAEEFDLKWGEFDEDDISHLEYAGVDARFELPLCELATVPLSCSCAQNTSLRCEAQNITQVPQDIPVQVTRLFLQVNNLGVLRGQPFENLTDLQTLNLKWNKITYIEVFVFAGLQNLQKLFLGYNELTSIKPGTLANLLNLEWLGLEGNRLSAILPGALAGPERLHWLEMEENLLDERSLRVLCQDLPTVEWLELERNSISSIGPETLQGCQVLTVLFLDYNNITRVLPETFSGLNRLADISLGANRIQSLPSDIFWNVSDLNHLNLSWNPMTELSADLFVDIPYLQSLDLSGLEITNISLSTFEGLPCLEYIYFSKFQYCGFTPHVRSCKPNSDGISSFEDLLANVVLRTCVWVVSIVTCTGNTGVIIGRTAIKQENKVHSFFIQNLCASDLIMGVYLLIIGTKDVMLRGVYNQHAEEWKTGYGCKLSGFLAMLSAEVSVLLLTYMSVERFLCVVFPYRDNRPDRWQAGMTILLIWLGGFLLALVPLMVPEYFGNFYGSNGVCFPLHLHEPYMAGWEYSAFVFIGINFSSLLVIMAAYIGMFISIQRTRSSIATPFSLLSDMSFAKRFFFIVLTDSLVWLPITAIKFMALTSGPISGTTYAWIVVFVLPINSAVNPILYSLTTKTFTTILDHMVKGGPLSCGPEVVKGTPGVTTTGGNSTCITGPTSSSQLGYPLRPLRAYRAKRSMESEMSVSSSCNPSVQIQFTGVGTEPMATNALSIRFHGRSLADVPEHPSCSEPSNREEESSGDEKSQKGNQTAMASPADTLDTSDGDNSINEANETPKTNGNASVVSTIQAEICNPPDSPTSPSRLSKLPTVLCVEEHVDPVSSSPTKTTCSDTNMEPCAQMTFDRKRKVTAV